jgi:hypothetical protein
MGKSKKGMNINEVRGHLFELIFDMSETETRHLLTELKERRKTAQKNEDKRKHPRKRTFIHVDCLGNKCVFTDFIQNISVSGLYIETQIPLFENQKLSMTFSPPDSENPIKIKGLIARVDSNGIGIQFDELIPDI